MVKYYNLFHRKYKTSVWRHFFRHIWQHSEITLPKMLILYFSVYPTLYFYNSKTRLDRQNQIAFLKSALKKYVDLENK